MANPTYKHLDAKLRLAGLRIVQWLQLAGAAGFALGFGMYLSPLSTGPTIALSVFVAGFPVAISFAAMGFEFSVSALVLSVIRWARSPKRYLPGTGETATGYVVHATPRTFESERAVDVTATSRIAALWD